MVINSDCLEAMALMPSSSIDLVATDPPYGYSFMGKDWDTFNEVVDPQGAFGKEKNFKKLPRNKPNGLYEAMLPVWKEALRVLKPGAFAFVMCAPRQDVLCKQIQALTDAGFDMGFSSIYWTYSSGFPKAHNIGKAVDKMMGAKREVVGKRTDGRYAYDFQDGNAQFVTNNRDNGIHTNTDKIGMITAPATPEAKALEGSYGGFQPKPAVEVIIVAMKPMDEKTFTSQALANGHGITWLDDCRIPYASNDEPTGGFGGMKIGIGKPTETQEYDGAKECNTKGRFPANLLVSDDVLNDGRIIKGGTYNQYNKGGGFDNLGDGTYNHGATINDKGSYSRYFDLDAWSNQLPFLIVPKASKKEKNAGCEELEDKENESLGTCQHHCRKCGKKRMCNNPCTCKDPEWYMPLQKNNHPTVKPLRLMSYLITMGSRPNQVVLDPFAGSGTTLVAAKQLGRRFIGIEMSAEYVEIINARLNAV